jgi:hypothetical protein
LPSPCRATRKTLAELSSEPKNLAAWYKQQNLKSRYQICGQLEVWSREFCEDGTLASWKVLTALRSDPEVVLVKKRVRAVAEAVAEYIMANDEDRRAARRLLRDLDRTATFPNVVLPPRPKVVNDKR